MAGVVDPDYTGEIKVVLEILVTLFKLSTNMIKLLNSLLKKHIEVVNVLQSTARGEKGFGSTDNPGTAFDLTAQRVTFINRLAF